MALHNTPAPPVTTAVFPVNRMMTSRFASLRRAQQRRALRKISISPAARTTRDDQLDRQPGDRPASFGLSIDTPQEMLQ